MYLKKNVHCNQPLLSVKLLKRGANSVAPDHEAASNLPLIAFTNLHLISSSMQKRADQLHNNNNDFAFATQIWFSCESRGGEQFGSPLDFPGMRGTGGRDPPGMSLNDPKF